MNILPNDCLYEIFRKLDSPQDRESFGLTCREWLSIQSSSRHSLQFRCPNNNNLGVPEPENYPNGIISSKIHRLLIRFRWLKSFTIVGWNRLCNSDLIHLELCGPTLRALYLSDCFRINDSGISHIAHGCRLLTIISLTKTKVTDIGLHTLSSCCLSLKSVDISRSLLVTDEGVGFLVEKCRKLRCLNISSCKRITGSGFKECPNTLTLVEAAGCKLQVPEGMMHILRVGSLEYLDLSFNTVFIRGDGLIDIESGMASRLRVLDFMMVVKVRDEAVIAIAKGCPLLQEWNLSFCPNVALPGWESIGLHCQNLERLHVNRCTSLCVVGLGLLRDGCPKLSVLYTGIQNSHLSELARPIFASRQNVELRYERISTSFPIEGSFTLEL